MAGDVGNEWSSREVKVIAKQYAQASAPAAACVEYVLDQRLDHGLITRCGLPHAIPTSPPAQGTAASMFIAAINVPLVYGLSRISWHESHPGQQPAYTLNSGVYQLSLLMQCIFPLSLYALVLYVCIKGTWRVPRALLGFVFVVMSLAIIVAVLFWKYDVPFYFYSGDFVYIALT